MKLLYCLKCGDVFNMKEHVEKKCDCGETGGKYVSHNDAIYYGPSVAFGIGSGSFWDAINSRPDHGCCEEKMRGADFIAFILARYNRNTIKSDPHFNINVEAKVKEGIINVNVDASPIETMEEAKDRTVKDIDNLKKWYEIETRNLKKKKEIA